MRNLLICFSILSCALIAGGTARADETVIHRDDDRPPGVVIPLPIPQPEPRDRVIEHRRQDCETKTVRRENAEGDSKTVTKSMCN